jgi:hypothetical protein
MCSSGYASNVFELPNLLLDILIPPGGAQQPTSAPVPLSVVCKVAVSSAVSLSPLFAMPSSSTRDRTRGRLNPPTAADKPSLSPARTEGELSADGCSGIDAADLSSPSFEVELRSSEPSSDAEGNGGSCGLIAADISILPPRGCAGVLSGARRRMARLATGSDAVGDEKEAFWGDGCAETNPEKFGRSEFGLVSRTV